MMHVTPLSGHLIVTPIGDTLSPTLVIPKSAAREKPWRFRVVARGQDTSYGLGMEIALSKITGRAFQWEGREYRVVPEQAVQAIVEA